MSKNEYYELFQNLQAEISKFSLIGKIVIMDDLNSGTGELQEKYVTL